MKGLRLLVIFMVWIPAVFSQTIPARALILIDIQEFYFDEDKLPLEGNLEAARVASDLLTFFRENRDLIIHILHKGGGEIHPLVFPLNGEVKIEKTHVNAFRSTDLESLLRERKIEELVMAGMQTHMCLEAAVRAADDLGFQCTVIHDACATRNLEFNNSVIKAKDVHLSTLNTLESYSLVITLDEFLKLEQSNP